MSFSEDKRMSWEILTFNIMGRQFKMTDFFIEISQFSLVNIPCCVGESKGKRSEKKFIF